MAPGPGGDFLALSCVLFVKHIVTYVPLSGRILYVKKEKGRCYLTTYNLYDSLMLIK